MFPFIILMTVRIQTIIHSVYKFDDFTKFFSSTHLQYIAALPDQNMQILQKYSKKYQIFTQIWTRPEGQRSNINTFKWLLMDYYLRNFSLYVNIKYFLQQLGHYNTDPKKALTAFIVLKIFLIFFIVILKVLQLLSHHLEKRPII